VTEFKQSYTGPRGDLARLVPASCRSFLDVGCATGELGASLKRARPGAHVVGIELDAAMAAEAAGKLDRVLTGDAGTMLDELVGERFDCVLCGDVLEHLVDPWDVVRRLAELLEPGGYIAASIPNVGHLDTLVSVFLRRRWPYRERGVHDRTHLRWFARRNVLDLFGQAGLEIVELRRNVRIVERPHGLNRLARFAALPGLRDLLTFQFLVLARRS